jgi:hypothetical protein
MELGLGKRRRGENREIKGILMLEFESEIRIRVEADEYFQKGEYLILVFMIAYQYKGCWVPRLFYVTLTKWLPIHGPVFGVRG